MKIAVGWDHRGRCFRDRLLDLLKKGAHEVVEMGAPSNESADYPDFAFRVAEAVGSGKAERGILVCGTGIGMSIAANKARGVRAAVVWDVDSARASRTHNDANVLCLGERIAAQPLLDEIVTVWLKTDFEGGRHGRRVDKIAAYEKQGVCYIKD